MVSEADATLRSVSKASDAAPRGMSSELLVEAAEIESRLRAHVLELVEPVIRRSSMLDAKLKETWATVTVMETTTTRLQRRVDMGDSTKAIIEGFRAELALWDRQRKEFEQATSERISMQELELDALRQNSDRRASDAVSLTRTLQNLTEVATTTKEELAELRHHCTERIDQNRDRILKLRDEFETRTMSVESEQHRMKDTQMSADAAISHVKADLERVSREAVSNIDSIRDLWKGKASVTAVEAQQQEFSEFAQEVNTIVSDVRSQFKDLVRDVKAHFETAAAVVGTSTAKQMDAMRAQYAEDVKRVDEVLRGIDEFVQLQRNLQLAPKAEVTQISDELRSEIRCLSESLDVHTRKYKAEASSLVMEVQQLRKSLREAQETVQGLDSGRTVRNDVLSMLLESQQVSVSLDMQDDSDRQSVALYGFKSNNHVKQPDSARTCSLPELESGGRKGTATPRRKSNWTPRAEGDGAAAPAAPVVSLDKRCLSCSGSQATVLAGFKLACLQYASSPVEYKSSVYQRQELIKLRLDLLGQAAEQLRSVD